VEEKTVEIYGTHWCPDCHRAKRFFESRGIPYRWYDIEDDGEAFKRAEALRKGYKRVPILLFPDGSVLIEPSDAALEAQLKKDET